MPLSDYTTSNNNPFSGRPFDSSVYTPDLMGRARLSQFLGLTGLDPKFIKDPRFDYVTRMGMNPEENRNAPVVLMGNPRRDDYDSAPVGVKSHLSVDNQLRKMLS